MDVCNRARSRNYDLMILVLYNEKLNNVTVFDSYTVLCTKIYIDSQGGLSAFYIRYKLW